MIFIQLKEQLTSLANLLQLLGDEQYVKKSVFLGNASIGGHSRHIIELLKCVTDGYKMGRVDYINRVRDIAIETDRLKAIQEIHFLIIGIIQADKPLQLVTEPGSDGTVALLGTTFFREIVYNAEHAIHHLALIRVALREMNLTLVDHNFGMAFSTIKYLSCRDKVPN